MGKNKIIIIMEHFFKKFTLGVLFLFLGACSKSSEISPSSTGVGGSLARFSIVGNVMYLVDNRQIKVFDITDAEKPSLIKKVNVFSTSVETIYQQGDYLFLGSSNGMYIYDIKDPRSPTYVSMATHAMGCDPVVSDGKYAYVTVRNTTICRRTTNANLLEIFDVTNPSYPVLVSSTRMVGPIGLAIDGDVLFVCDDSLKIFDVKDKVNPKKIKALASKAVDIIINGANIITVDTDGINQYSYNRSTLDIVLRSRIVTKH